MKDSTDSEEGIPIIDSENLTPLVSLEIFDLINLIIVFELDPSLEVLSPNVCFFAILLSTSVNFKIQQYNLSTYFLLH